MNFIIPTIILSLLSVLVFILPSDAGEKIGFSTTILLSLVVFLQMLGDATPPTSDDSATPIVALFSMFSMVLIMLSFGLFTINNFIVPKFQSP